MFLLIIYQAIIVLPDTISTHTGRRSDDGGGSITCHWTKVPWADCGLKNGICASWPALSCLSLITTQRRYHLWQSLKVWDATVALLSILHELRITDWPHLLATLERHRYWSLRKVHHRNTGYAKKKTKTNR